MKTRNIKDSAGDVALVGRSVMARHVRVEHVRDSYGGSGTIMLYTREQSRAVRKAMKRAERELIT